MLARTPQPKAYAHAHAQAHARAHARLTPPQGFPARGSGEAPTRSHTCSSGPSPAVFPAFLLANNYFFFAPTRPDHIPSSNRQAIQPFFPPLVTPPESWTAAAPVDLARLRLNTLACSTTLPSYPAARGAARGMTLVRPRLNMVNMVNMVISSIRARGRRKKTPCLFEQPASTQGGRSPDTLMSSTSDA